LAHTRNNEGKACDAVLTLLEELTGTVRSRIRHPEKERIGPPVELRVNLGQQNYAMEHTLIQSFPEQIKYGVRFHKLIKPVLDVLSGTLPGSAIYYLVCPLDAGLDLKPKELNQAHDALVYWIRETAQRLNEKSQQRSENWLAGRRVQDSETDTPAGLQFEVTLTRRSFRNPDTPADKERAGRLYPSRVAPEDLDQSRMDQMRTSLKRKLPKLWKCKLEGARTVLILEDQDIALSNPVLVRECVESLMNQRNDWPDEIHLVETSTKRWYVWLLMRDGAFSPNESPVEIESAELFDITSAG